MVMEFNSIVRGLGSRDRSVTHYYPSSKGVVDASGVTPVRPPVQVPGTVGSATRRLVFGHPRNARRSSTMTCLQ